MKGLKLGTKVIVRQCLVAARGQHYKGSVPLNVPLTIRAFHYNPDHTNLDIEFAEVPYTKWEYSDAIERIPETVSTVDPKQSAGSKKLSYVNLPASFLAETARAINTGAEKYGRYNWQQYPVELLTYINAIMRHCQLLLAGQDYAEDSHLLHVSHIAATCAVIIDALYHGTLVDNRGSSNQRVIAKLEEILNDPTPK